MTYTVSSGTLNSSIPYHTYTIKYFPVLLLHIPIPDAQLKHTHTTAEILKLNYLMPPQRGGGVPLELCVLLVLKELE